MDVPEKKIYPKDSFEVEGNIEDSIKVEIVGDSIDKVEDTIEDSTKIEIVEDFLDGEDSRNEVEDTDSTKIEIVEDFLNGEDSTNKVAYTGSTKIEIIEDSLVDEAHISHSEVLEEDPTHVAIQIKEMLAKAHPPFTPECCIYRVPVSIRNSNKDAYSPKVVSVGPLHHGDTKLLGMESYKQVCCKKFIERSGASLDNLVSSVQELEPQVRRCYSENIKLNAEKLVKVILVDCGFIFEYFSRCRFGEPIDDVLLKPWSGQEIYLDLLLLENQLPFFVFEKLYNLAFASHLKGSQCPTFLSLVSHFFKRRTNLESLLSTDSIAHFTDLLRTSYLGSHGRPLRVNKFLTHLYSATELDEAGLKFRVNEPTDCSLNLQFSRHCLKIPKIEVEDDTETLLRNVMALEECHYPYDHHVTDYIAVLDYLINTDKDVDVLVKNEIIVNMLGDSNAVATLFNGLGKNITLSNFNADYLHTAKGLNDYYKHPLHSKMATLRRDYCNTPWKTVASIAGIALLILTVTQTVCSILQVA